MRGVTQGCVHVKLCVKCTTHIYSALWPSTPLYVKCVCVCIERGENVCESNKHTMG